MFLAVAILLAVVWALGYLAFHVTTGLIHLLVLFAVIAFIVHMMRASSRTIW
jgi:Family of unknown function (DUF5670)